MWEGFFAYCIHEHRHLRIGYHAPDSVHYGTWGGSEGNGGHPRCWLAANAARFGGGRREPPKLSMLAWMSEPAGSITQKAS